MNHHQQTPFPYQCFRFFTCQGRCTACLLLIALLALAAPHAGCGVAEQTEDFVHMPPADFYKALVGQNGGLLDIRTPQEFAMGKIPGAALILDNQHPGFADRVSALDRSAPYFIYCRTGNRTSQAMRVFQNLGFAKVIGLSGGIENWARHGYPVTK